MTIYWREAVLTYLRYSNICAKVVRQALKSDLRKEAAKRDSSRITFTQWKDGKPVPKRDLEAAYRK